MSAFNGGAVLILIAIVVVIAFGKEIVEWCDGRSDRDQDRDRECPTCGAHTPMGVTDAPGAEPAYWLCNRCVTAYPHLVGEPTHDIESRCRAAAFNGDGGAA